MLIDLPKNVQQARSQPVFPKEVHVRGYNPDQRASDIELNEIIGLIEKSERPVLYVGGGIISGNASEELRRFVEATQIPVTTTLMGCGSFPEDQPLSLRWLGMHGAAFANWRVNGEFEPRLNPNDPLKKIAHGADLLLAFGVRFDDRVTGKVDKFCETGTIVHLDIDPLGDQQEQAGQLADYQRRQVRPGPLGRHDPRTTDTETLYPLAPADCPLEDQGPLRLRRD